MQVPVRALIKSATRRSAQALLLLGLLTAPRASAPVPNAAIDRLLKPQKVLVEVFHMNGVPRLQTEHVIDGRPVSLMSLFLPGGLEIEVVMREPDLPFVERASLEQLRGMLGGLRAASRSGEWTAAVLVANEMEQFEGNLSIVLTDADAHDVAVIFAKSHRALKEKASLSMFLSAAHEATHFFNLHHRDWEGTSFNQDATIEGFSMVDTVRWKLSQASVQHLRYAPDNFVRPDGVPFGQVLAEHEARHQRTPNESYTVVNPTPTPGPKSTPPVAVATIEPRSIRPNIAWGSDLPMMDPDKRTTTRESLLIYFTVRSVGASLSEIIVTVSAADGRRELRRVRDPHPHQQQFQVPVPLQVGSNSITVTAIDAARLRSEEVIEVVREEQARKLIAVVIGAQTYQRVRPLKFAIKDAKAIRDHLLTLGGEPDRLLLVEDPDVEMMRTVLGTWLPKNAGTRDIAIVYFAGHGAYGADADRREKDGVQKYLLPVGADLGNLYATALPWAEFTSVLNRVKVDTLIVILDACFSGAAAADGRTVEAAPTRAILNSAFLEDAAGAGRIFLTASGPNETAEERKELEHGVFTFFMLEGMKGKADTGGDDTVDLAELYAWVAREVKRETAGRQQPELHGEVRGSPVLWRKQ